MMLEIKPPTLVPTTFSTIIGASTKGVIVENDGVNSKIVLPMDDRSVLICIANNKDYYIK